MRVRQISLLACTVVSCLVGQSPPWRSLARATFRGNATFPADEIRRAIGWYPPAVLAISEGDQATACDVLASGIVEGYRRAGFAEASVRTKVTPVGLEFDIVEGRRARCGQIVFEGNLRVPTADLIAALRAEQDPEVSFDLVSATARRGRPRVGLSDWWRPSEFARCDASSATAAAAAIADAYGRLGFTKARATVSFRPSGERVDLHVAVLDEGDQVRVASVMVVGEQVDALPAVMARIAWQPGCLYTRALRDDLERQLLRTGRYATVRCDEPGPHQRLLDPLVLRVQRVGYPPGDDAGTQRDFAQLLAMFEAVARHFEQGRGVLFTGEVPAAEVDAAGWIGPGALRARLGHQSLSVEVEALRGSGGRYAPFSCDLTSDAILLVHGDRWAFARAAGIIGLELALESRPQTGLGAQELNWGVGIRTGVSGSSQRVRFHPTTAAYLLQEGPVRCRRDGDHLVLRVGHADLRIGPDGTFEPREIPVGGTAGGPSGRVSLADEGGQIDFDARRARLPAGQEVPIANLLSSMCLGAALDRIEARGIDLGEAQPLFHAIRRLPMPAAAAELFTAHDRFSIVWPNPPAEHKEGIQSMIGRLATFLAATWPGDGWPAAVLGAGPRLLGEGGSAQRAASHLYELREDPKFGPLALSTIAAAIQWLGFDRPAAIVRKEALGRCSFDNALADLESMTRPDGFVGELLRSLGRHWRTDPATAALCKVPDGPDADLVACRKGLQMLWDAGLGAALRRALGGEGR